MQELLIVNPAKRPSKRRKTRKAASPAQKRARAAFAAAARARAGKKRTSAKRRSKPATAITVMSNPKKRRVTRRRNPVARAGGLLKKPMAMLTPALMGALGATAVNTILGKLPLPAKAMTGKMRYVTQAAAAIGLSMVAQKLGVKGALAAQMAEGSLTVTLHQAITETASGMGMNLSGMGYYLPGAATSAVPSRSANSAPMALNGMGKYLTGPGSAKVTPITSRGLSGVSSIRRGSFGF